MSLTAVQILTLLIIGFSVFAAAILLLTYLFFLENMQKTVAGKSACAVCSWRCRACSYITSRTCYSVLVICSTIDPMLCCC